MKQILFKGIFLSLGIFIFSCSQAATVAIVLPGFSTTAFQHGAHPITTPKATNSLNIANSGCGGGCASPTAAMPWYTTITTINSASYDTYTWNAVSYGNTAKKAVAACSCVEGLGGLVMGRQP